MKRLVKRMNKIYVTPAMDVSEVEMTAFMEGAFSVEVDNDAKDNIEGDAKQRGEDEDFSFGSLW